MLFCIQLVRSRVMRCSCQTTVCSTMSMIRSCARHIIHGMTRRRHPASTVECTCAASQCCSLAASTDSMEWSLSAVLIAAPALPVSFTTALCITDNYLLREWKRRPSCSRQTGDELYRIRTDLQFHRNINIRVSYDRFLKILEKAVWVPTILEFCWWSAKMVCML